MPRPKINLPKSPADTWYHLATALALAILIGVSASGFADVPAAIPFRFSMNGWPFPYPDRLIYLGLPLLGLLIFVLVQLLTRRVHRFPFPVRITHFNAASEYRSAIRMMRFLLAMLLLGLAYIQYLTVQVELGGYSTPGLWLVAVYALFMVGGTIYFLRQLYAPVEKMPALQF